MEENPENNTKLNININRELLYGPEFSQKIKEVKLVIDGLRGVIKHK